MNCAQLSQLELQKPRGKEMYSEALIIAARCLGGLEADAGLLHFRLAEDIRSASLLVSNAGGILRSRQVIALIILEWKRNNPGQSAYGDIC